MSLPKPTPTTLRTSRQSPVSRKALCFRSPLRNHCFSPQARYWTERSRVRRSRQQLGLRPGGAPPGLIRLSEPPLLLGLGLSMGECVRRDQCYVLTSSPSNDDRQEQALLRRQPGHSEEQNPSRVRR